MRVFLSLAIAALFAFVATAEAGQFNAGSKYSGNLTMSKNLQGGMVTGGSNASAAGGSTVFHGKVSQSSQAGGYNETRAVTRFDGCGCTTGGSAKITSLSETFQSSTGNVNGSGSAFGNSSADAFGNGGAGYVGHVSNANGYVQHNTWKNWNY